MSEAAAAASSNHEVDLGHLMAYDPSHHLAAAPASRAELREECLRKATELAQAVADALFSLPATEGRDGPVVRLPPPANRLPREKHVRRRQLSFSLSSLLASVDCVDLIENNMERVLGCPRPMLSFTKFYARDVVVEPESLW
jgi:hypothetical protein